MMDEGTSSKRIAVMHGDRVYGSENSLAAEFVQEVPEALRELAVDLRQRSALLALADAPGLEKRAIFEAYGRDLGLLKRRLAEFDACVLQAIKSSVICQRGGAEKPKDVWEALKEQVPTIGRAPLLDLSHTRAALPAHELLPYLKAEFEAGIERVLRLMACWLQFLVEAEFIGLVEWAGALDVCRYHYFRHERTREVLVARQRSEQTSDESQPYGQRITYRDWVERVIRRREFKERHVHDIVQAKLHSVGEYPRRVPERIAEFLDAVPAWLRPLLQIVEGTITREEIVRRTTGDTTAVETDVISEWKGSPGVLLGNFNLIGWSDDDLRGVVRYYQGQAARRLTWPKVRARFWRFALAAAGVSAVAAGIGWFVWYVAVGEPRARAEAHAAYASRFSQALVVETRKGERLSLPVGADVRYAGVGRSNNQQNRMHLLRGIPTGDEVRLPWLGVSGLELTLGKDGILYGDADLAQAFGVFAKLHVLSAEESVVRYVVTPYGK